jgi:hypothetical protein
METEWYETKYEGYWITKNADFKKVYKSKEVIYKGTISKRLGYLMVSLGRETGKKTLHSIMAETFLTNPNGYRNVDHINRNKLDNRLENLRYFSQTDNMLNRDKIRGIYFIEDRNYWVSKSGQEIIGYFKTEDEARACKLGWLKAKGITIESDK